MVARRGKKDKNKKKAVLIAPEIIIWLATKMKTCRSLTRSKCSHIRTTTILQNTPQLRNQSRPWCLIIQSRSSPTTNLISQATAPLLVKFPTKEPLDRFQSLTRFCTGGPTARYRTKRDRSRWLTPSQTYLWSIRKNCRSTRWTWQKSILILRLVIYNGLVWTKKAVCSQLSTRLSESLTTARPRLTLEMKSF